MSVVVWKYCGEDGECSCKIEDKAREKAKASMDLVLERELEVRLSCCFFQRKRRIMECMVVSPNNIKRMEYVVVDGWSGEVKMGEGE